MFSYRHAFHAGNHADVLKHTTLLSILRHMVEKEAALTVVDTHAGAGLYRLDGDYAAKSAESADGIFRLFSASNTVESITGKAQPAMLDIANPLAPALEDYRDLIRSFNADRQMPKVYPGSPFVIEHVLRRHDRLKLFELHPTDARALEGNIAQLDAGRRVSVFREDGFEGAKKFLPPPARRALVLCDPSYELKEDYARVLAFIADSLRRFATGTYAVWYPLIARPDAHDLPKRLRTMATQAGKSWLHASLTVKSSRLGSSGMSEAAVKRPGLPASGMFVINPPFTLKPALAEALPQLVQLLAQDRHASHVLESGGS
jgi:23S rRNA (adenine2030-N6)-methyltransferase